MPQAQLRHFASDPDRRSMWVYDKRLDKAYVSSILNAGSENDFNTVDLPTGRWNFEDVFAQVDGRSAALVTSILDARSLSWMTPDDHVALVDLFVTQMLRTHFTRLTPKFLAEQMRDIVSDLGFDPDADPDMALPTEASLRLGAVRAFLERSDVAQPLFRLRPSLFEAPPGEHFILSDDPVVRTNAFSYGDQGLSSHGILVGLPIAPGLEVVLVCPTIVSRYEAADLSTLVGEQRARVAAHRNGFRTGALVRIDKVEMAAWNQHQVSGSARYLYAAKEEHFAEARSLVSEHAELRVVETSARLGRMGGGLPRRAGMPAGRHLVVNGKHDHAILAIAEVDDAGEGLTARTTDLGLLGLVATDPHPLRAELCENGHVVTFMGQAKLERFGEPSEGWFRVVQHDPSVRDLFRRIDVLPGDDAELS